MNKPAFNPNIPYEESSGDKPPFDPNQPYDEDSGLNEENQKGFLREMGEGIIKSEALPIAGGIIGGLAGLPAAPVTGGLSSVGGAALGGAAGESYRQLAARKMGLETPKTSIDAARKIAGSGAEQGAYEALGGYVITPAVKGAARLLKKPAEQMFEIVTKMKPKEATTLFKNPSAIMPGRFEAAKEGWRSAAKGIGLNVDDVSPDMLKILKEPGGAKKIVYETYEKIATGQPVTAQEVQIAKQAMDISVMPEAKTIRKNPIVTTLSKIRQSFVERLGKESPEMAAANKEYGIAATGSKFRSLFPRNKTGDPAYFRSTILPTIMGGFGATKENSGPGTVAAYAAGTALASSPLALGLGIAGAGSVRGAAPLFRRMAVSGIGKLAKENLNGDENVANEASFKKPLFKTGAGNGSSINQQEASPQNYNPNNKQWDRPNNADGKLVNYIQNSFLTRRLFQDRNATVSDIETENTQDVDNQIVSPKILDEATAREYLKQAGGNKAKAREMAITDGWEL